MTCDAVGKLIPLYYYGELTPDEEDRVEEHLHECAGCAAEAERHGAFASALDRRRVEVPPLLLEDCRADLVAAIHGGAPRSARAELKGVSKGPWTLFLEAMSATFGGLGRLRQPLGAAAMIAIGFLAARFTATTPNAAQVIPADTSGNVFATVRSVRADNSGQVRIAFDETRRREVAGSPEDPAIQRLMLAAVRELNPSVRVESVELLKNRAESSEVREALLTALAQDPNVGVRLKALEGLEPLAGDPEVRKTLAQALLKDDNPAVRQQAVELLVAHRDDSMVGLLQNAFQREGNSAVRGRLEKALKELNASIGTF
jgi:anti-sigma factor RsiW